MTQGRLIPRQLKARNLPRIAKGPHGLRVAPKMEPASIGVANCSSIKGSISFPVRAIQS
jgi:hypothetical protein